MKHILIILFALMHCAVAGDGKFTPLFDGKTLNGWTPTPGGKWEVRDGVIVGTSPRSEKRHGILLSDRQYTNFVVKAQFRAVQGDSGFYFRVQRVNHAVSVRGFQVEVDTTQETGGLYETLGRGWVHKPTPEVIKQRKYRPGEWTDLELSAIDGNLTVKINGVVSTRLTNDKGSPSGHFGLQLHGSADLHVEFRNLKIKELK